jgi:hypothetical protein
VVEAFNPKLAGEQLSEVGTVGAVRLTVATAETLFRVAVIVELWVLVRVPVVALKVAEEDPAATFTEAGTVKAVFVLESVTNEPPDGAA